MAAGLENLGEPGGGQYGLKHCSINVERFRGALVFKAPILFYHLTLGLSVIRKKIRNNAAGGMKPFMVFGMRGHPVDYARFVSLDSEGNVTKFAPHKAPNLIA